MLSFLIKSSCWIILIDFKGHPGLSNVPNALPNGMCLIWGDGKATGFAVRTEFNHTSITWRDLGSQTGWRLLLMWIGKTEVFILFYFILFFSFFFPFIFICSEFCHTLKWKGLGFTCLPHPDPPSHHPPHLLPPGPPRAPGPRACLLHPTWAGNLFHPWFFCVSLWIQLQSPRPQQSVCL